MMLRMKNKYKNTIIRKQVGDKKIQTGTIKKLTQ